MPGKKKKSMRLQHKGVKCKQSELLNFEMSPQEK